MRSQGVAGIGCHLASLRSESSLDRFLTTLKLVKEAHLGGTARSCGRGGGVVGMVLASPQVARDRGGPNSLEIGQYGDIYQSMNLCE